jgi:nitronate monooxygenase
VNLLDALELRWPIIQAPMAGVSTPAMAAAVSNAGGLGSIGVGASNAAGARAMIAELSAKTTHAFNVNVFCHRPATTRPHVESAWLARLRPEFERLGAVAPTSLREIYRSFVEDDEMLALFTETRPRVVSFHFGLPASDRIAALRDAGTLLFATATSLAEARALEAAGIHAIVAQGWEAGGHRGTFDPDAQDDQLGTFALVRVLVRSLSIPVIAAGGIMDGAGIAASLRLGAVAAQLGTAFVAADESAADAGYRAAFERDSAHHTVMTRAISGRPARSLANRMTALGETVKREDVPDYPIAYDAGKALHTAGKARAEFGYGAQWAGQGAPLIRRGSTASIMAQLIAELQSS